MIFKFTGRIVVAGIVALSPLIAQAGEFTFTSFGAGLSDGAACGQECGECCAEDVGCGEACGEGCGALFGSGCGAGSLFSCLHKSDHCFDDFISPMTNPVFFEDPRTLTEARVIYLNQSIPGGGLGGNNVQLFAVQARAALTDDLSIIATKDGYIWSDNPLVDDGWADISAGLKLNIHKDVCSQTIISVGAVYELPVGTPDALQGNGDGEFHLFASGGTEFAEDWHWVTGSGFRLPVDQDAESTVWYWSNHVDRKIGDTGLYFLGECNWYNWLNDGDTFPVAVEGMDLINLGAIGVEHNNIVTGAIGVKYKPSANTEIGFAWEIPLTDRQDLLNDRYTIDWILRY